MADTTLCTFAELEFLLRSAAGPGGERAAAMDAVRRRLGLRPEAATDIVTAAGVASLLARGLCTDEGGNVVPGQFVLGAVAALSTLRTVTEAAGSAGDRTLQLHLFSGDTGRLAAYPGPFGLYGVDVLDPAEPLAAPLARFVDRCTAGPGEAAVAIRSADAGEDSAEVGLAIARAADGSWLLSDDGPDAVTAGSRDDVVAALVERFGHPVAAGA
ncbi:hypothetical protein Daura_42135 [Dactylosporangium aurantiacum]|uniref:Uncharacterized protein n=1 Tax=Dactylosporangium aurantiacum TaxID=35754 RepID=A0A9Q9ID68_9ACTN|nr:hypothetical protein [Dactylosporangium aurantiacum]MDG6102622.1 hypothetical protein [Dactylosporangium aurantiacum]UWZ53121.1 hypothetical protein Daura_42135 [Dactylosporangium aurantiacum]